LVAIAERAALAGGAVLMERFGGVASGVDHKTSATDPVSDADRAAEASIREVTIGLRVCASYGSGAAARADRP